MRVINIRGTHGSGKTRLVQWLMSKSLRPSLSLPFNDGGKERPAGHILTLGGGKSVGIVGPYPPGLTAGGCDKLRHKDTPQQMIYHLVQHHKHLSSVVFEGQTITSSWQRWADTTEVLVGMGHEFIWFFLMVDAETACKRVMERNGGKQPKMEHIERKVHDVARCIQLCELNKFRHVVVDATKGPQSINAELLKFI